MCRRLLFISMVVMAVSSVTLAQAFVPGCSQHSCFIGAGATGVAQGGGLGSSYDNNFTSGYQLDMGSCGPCGTQTSQSNAGFIDQGTAAGGCGGYRSAGQVMIGGGTQCQTTGYVPSNSCVPCYPCSTQCQTVGGMGTQGVVNTCGSGAASASQAGAASESQNVTTPITSGSQYQYLAGTQGGMAYGRPTSFSTAGGTISGGGAQCQSFGGIPVN
ncbi:MAG: hypothetical protein JW955_15940 [Sedimentisphaerales bacterium]|nr:hypothetical protein [Sedimentisphaerales bacterium]